MKTTEQVHSAAVFDQDAERLASLVRAGFDRIGGPSISTLRAISGEAARHASRAHWVFHLTPLTRSLAAAAAVAALAGVAIQTRLARQAGRHAHTVNQLLNLGAPQAAAAAPARGPSELADRLLNIQGLDEEAFFTQEGAEALWL